MDNPRKEYPRPEMVRPEWLNLNGEWDFEFDFGRSGKDRGMAEDGNFTKKILVPFCPESKLSGIEYKDFIAAVWYRRSFTLPSGWQNGRVLLHFEAVDYRTEVWINGKPAGTHRGGYTPFSLDITGFITLSENTVTVYAEDEVRDLLQPSGKQSRSYHSAACDYTRVTGIWQTVWLEHLPESYIKSYRCEPDPDNGKVDLFISFAGTKRAKSLTASALYEGEPVGETTVMANGENVRLSIALKALHLWQPLDAKLYDLKLTLKAGDQTDSVEGYFGMRKIELSDNAMLINGRPVFQRLILDQGFYPDGIYTAPDAGALKKDIELSLSLGFNGARMHQRVFERRYLYWADHLGYLVWGEYASWGLNHADPRSLEAILPEWLESVERDRSHPALIGWCPFNETWDIDGHRQDDEVLRSVYLATKAADPTRPVIDTSGNYHVITDIFDIHDYTQEVEKFASYFKPMASDGEVFNTFPDRQSYCGQPYFVSEYGGIWWKPGDGEGWGYGSRPKSEDEFVARYIGLAQALLSSPRIFALCYTQLYDIEQEVNGLYYYDRTPKFSEEVREKLRGAMAGPAAIEEAIPNANKRHC